ncbi:MAG TPA: hypothetical protein PLZ57_10505 [Pseudobdellovibrionaceae bacterium]|nr:hypothetical protein [Pseudobdellovibrionaceae bacterium]
MNAWAGAQSEVKLIRSKIVSVSIADRPAQWRLEVVWTGRVDAETGMVADLALVDQAMSQLSFASLEVTPGPRAAQQLLAQLQSLAQQLASSPSSSEASAGPGLPLPSELRLISRANKFIARA